MATTGYIYDPQNGRCLARVIDGEKVFAATSANGAQIGTVRGGNIFDLQGNLVGRLGPNDCLEETATPEAFKKTAEEPRHGKG